MTKPYPFTPIVNPFPSVNGMLHIARFALSRIESFEMRSEKPVTTSGIVGARLVVEAESAASGRCKTF